MGLFDRKYCDICGNKIGLLGNKKLEDGNMCKDCQKLLSPWFSDRRHSTIAEIKDQLAYREANKAKVAAFAAARSFGGPNKLLLDDEKQQFLVTGSSRWQEENPDVLDFAALSGYEMKIGRTRLEEKTKDAEGKMVSFDPPRFTYTYSFHVRLLVNNPYFDDMAFSPFYDVREKGTETDGRPVIEHGPDYKKAKAAMDELKAALDALCSCVSYTAPDDEAEEEETAAPAAAPAFTPNQPVNTDLTRFVFPSLPNSVAELLALPGVSLHNPFSVAAAAVAALCAFPNSAELCFDMLNALKGPQPLTPMEKSFIRDRFMDGKDYVPRSYFAGANPQNDYKVSSPYCIKVNESAHSRDQFDQGYITLYLKSGGADSERPITLRHKPSTDEWFLWTFDGILAGIRVPVSSDPWA